MSSVDKAKGELVQAIEILREKYYVSRETLSDLEFYHDAIVNWNRSKNIVSSGDIPQLWSRHILDCFRLRQFRPSTKHWIDLGSGAGLPGVVLAISLKGHKDAKVHLVETNGKKAAFLNAMRREMALPVVVHHTRVENLELTINTLPYTVTARAFAPLPKLAAHFEVLSKCHTIDGAIWMKGANWRNELGNQSRYRPSDFAEARIMGQPSSSCFLIQPVQIYH